MTAMKVLGNIIPILIILFLISAGTLSIKEDAKDVVKKSDMKMRGKTSTAEMTIQIVRPTWSREMTLKAWSKETTLAMILITSPVRERGTVFLKRDKEVWNWVPSIERIIKLPPSMMTQSWMGTDFTNDDLVKESSVVDDYIHSFAGDSVIEGRDCYKIQLIPKPEAAVVWGKILLWIDKKDYLQMGARFYDEENALVSTMRCSEIKIMGGRLIPTKVEMVPADKKGQKTVMLYTSISFDQPIEDYFFTTQNMKKVK